MGAEVRRAATAATATAVARLLTFGLGAITSVWTARALGPYGRGVWSIALLVTSVLSLLTESGIGQAALFILGKRPDRHRAVMRLGLLLVATSGCVWTVLTVALAGDRRFPIADLPTPALVIAALAGLAAGITLNTRQLLAVLGDWDSMNRSVLLQPLTLLAALLPAFLIFAPSPVGALTAFVTSLLVTAAFGLSRLRSLGLAGPATDPTLVWPLFTHGLRSQVATVALTLTYRSDLLLVNQFLGAANAGVYSVALTLSEILRVVAETAQVVVVTQAMTDDIEHHAQALARQSAVLTLIAGVFLCGLCGFVVPVVFGASFSGAVKAFWCLVPGSVALAYSYSLSPLLVLQGRMLFNGAAALIGLGVLWTVGAWGPGVPSLAKFALASSLAYWTIAITQIAWLWRSRRLSPANLFPTHDDVRSVMRAGWLIARRYSSGGGNGCR